jgi:hypothetical protein
LENVISMRARRRFSSPEPTSSSTVPLQFSTTAESRDTLQGLARVLLASIWQAILVTREGAGHEAKL